MNKRMVSMVLFFTCSILVLGMTSLVSSANQSSFVDENTGTYPHEEMFLSFLQVEDPVFEEAKVIYEMNQAAQKALEKQLEEERLEAERIRDEWLESERRAEEQRVFERLEMERLEMERLEMERLEKERLEVERLEAARKEEERRRQQALEEERLEAERLALEKEAAEAEEDLGGLEETPGEDDSDPLPQKEEPPRALPPVFTTERVPAAWGTIYYATKRTALFEDLESTKEVASIPAAAYFVGEEVAEQWLYTRHQGRVGYVPLKDLRGFSVMRSGATIIVNKTYGLPAAFHPGVNPEAQEALKNLLAAAKSQGLSLINLSGFRSYQQQQSTHNHYLRTYGAAYAERISLRAGHSEHQTGLAFDIGASGGRYNLSRSFGETNAGKWLAQHAAQYGFIVRYPEGKESITGILYEPWHFRYVGPALAQAITASGLTLDEYFNALGPHY